MTSRKKPIPKDETSSSTQPQISKKDYINSIIKKRQKSKFLSDNQKEYYDILINNQITICSGPAVEAEEKLGSLPGNLEEKLDPYIFPSYYLLNKIIGKEAREKLKEVEVIEVFALAYMRGMNIDNSILIFEEAQNSTPNQMKLLLTRIGFNSKFFISGDLEQTDRYKDKKQSGLYDALQRFNGISDIGVYDFKNAKNVRNPLISKLLNKYDEENRD
jgi:phosphate starvation-inducible PhoH-like protein